MSEGHHHHEHGEDCHCHECEEHGHHHDHEHHHEETSLDIADGVAEGFQGTLFKWDAKSEEKLAEALLKVGKWIEKETGTLLGHVKAAVFDENGKGISLNLTSVESGVEHHGTLDPMDKVRFAFMAAVVDVDGHELKHRMFHAIDDMGMKYELDEKIECCCHDHHHEHEHEHGEDCHCHECEEKHKNDDKHEDKPKKRSFFSFRRSKK